MVTMVDGLLLQCWMYADHIPNESSIADDVNGGGNKVVRESYRVFSYQPGKSLLNLNSFVFSPPVTGLRQREVYLA